MSENQRPFTSAILVAAGGSTRMGVPKQTIPLCGIPVIVRTLLAFEAAQRVDEILLVTREEDVEAFARLCQDYGAAKVRRVLPGGETRQQSVARGVAAADAGAAYLAIHDGARPLVRPAVIDGVIAAAMEWGGAAAGVPVKDTVKVADEAGFIVSTPDRRRLWNVQTPQVFEKETYLRALRQAQAEGLEFTDDCQLVERLAVLCACGRRTTPISRSPPRRMWPSRKASFGRERNETSMRIGHGYDVHRLVEGRRLILGGVEIPYEKGLLGHSDADVLAHAVADACWGRPLWGISGGCSPIPIRRFWTPTAWCCSAA